jgi:hypothetical protein
MERPLRESGLALTGKANSQSLSDAKDNRVLVPDADDPFPATIARLMRPTKPEQPIHPPVFNSQNKQTPMGAPPSGHLDLR